MTANFYDREFYDREGFYDREFLCDREFYDREFYDLYDRESHKNSLLVIFFDLRKTIVRNAQ